MFKFSVRFCKHIQSIYFGDSQNPNNASDNIVIVSLYFYNIKFILFRILAASLLCHIGWIFKFAQLARSRILAN